MDAAPRWTENELVRTGLIAFAICCLVGGLLIGIGFALSSRPRRIKRAEFDSTAWRDAPLTGDLRQRMVDDLLARDLLRALGKPEVEELLGPPDYREDPEFGDEVFYKLGPHRQLTMEDEWLVIEFGSDGRVMHADITSR